jgi:hypothetical protein
VIARCHADATIDLTGPAPPSGVVAGQDDSTSGRRPAGDLAQLSQLAKKNKRDQ